VIPRIAVVQYGAANLTSVLKGLTAAGGDPFIAHDPAELAGVAAIVVPGVGHFAATAALHEGWRAAIMTHIDAGRPLLGICLGMQWLFDGSDEAPGVNGLGIFKGRCEQLRGNVKVPHVGWNTIERTAPAQLLAGSRVPAWAYFTHSFAAPADAKGVVACSVHGGRFAAVVERGAVHGMQYHPEKSGDAGIAQLAAFVRLAGDGR
jgi:glutamine amidotransferase